MEANNKDAKIELTLSGNEVFVWNADGNKCSMCIYFIYII